MLISATMNLSDLAERMGTEATTEEAARMRDVLCRTHEGEDTSEVDAAEWDAMLAEIAAQ